MCANESSMELEVLEPQHVVERDQNKTQTTPCSENHEEVKTTGSVSTHHTNSVCSGQSTEDEKKDHPQSRPCHVEPSGCGQLHRSFSVPGRCKHPAEDDCKPPTGTEYCDRASSGYCDRASLLGTLVNCVNQLRNDLVELDKDVKKIGSSKVKMKSSELPESYMNQLFSKLQLTLGTGLSQICGMLVEVKALPLCVHTSKSLSSCPTDDLRCSHQLPTEEVDTLAEKQQLAIEQLSQLCMMKTSVISQLQDELEANEKELKIIKATSELASNEMDRLQKEKRSLEDDILKLKEDIAIDKMQNQTYKEDFLKEREDRISANKIVYDHAEELKTLRSQHEETSAELKECKRELELAKEEIAVKVAQVKQYQKQVEAYKQQLAQVHSGVTEDHAHTQDDPSLIANTKAPMGTQSPGIHVPVHREDNVSIGALSSSAPPFSSAACAESSADGTNAVNNVRASDATDHTVNEAVQSEQPSAWPNSQCGNTGEAHMKPQESASMEENKPKNALEESLPAPIYFKQPHHDYPSGTCISLPEPAAWKDSHVYYNHSLQPHLDFGIPNHATFHYDEQFGNCQRDQNRSDQGHMIPDRDRNIQPLQYSPVHGPDADKPNGSSSAKPYPEIGKSEEINTSASDKGVNIVSPYDLNLKCQVCQKCFRKGEIQLYRSHTQTCTINSTN